METKMLFGTRLRQAREAAGFSLRKLAAQLQSVVSHAQLAKYEKGQDVPSSAVLLALCSALACSPDQLFRPMHAGVDAIAFRKKSRATKSGEKAVKARVQDSVDRYFELEGIVGVESKPLAPVGLRCSSGEDAEKAAVAVRDQWGLGENPIANMIELLEEHHIKVQQVDVNEHFDGCSGWGQAGDMRFPIIVLANWLGNDLPRKRFTAAHELGHLVMDMPRLDAKEQEKACHRFAGAFLLPRTALVAHIGPHRRQVEWKELAFLKQEYGLSMAAALHRLHDHGIINDALYRQLCIAINVRGWRTQEPGTYVGTEECFRFRQLLYRGLAEAKISLTKAAELAGLDTGAFQKELVTLGGGCG
jgi:Zn-dependent peptidase ImmA (M78 family)/transcriptional regulator with XRE-family HTH domain